MPLKKVKRTDPIAKRRKVANENIKELLATGHSQSQAVAIAYKSAYLPSKKKRKK